MKKAAAAGQVSYAAQGAGLVALVLFGAVAALFCVAVLFYPQLYILATYEDLPGEWAQVFFFGAAMVASLWIIRRPHPYRPFFTLLALACFYVVGEEISWGQRLFTFASPDFFQRHNLQQEINLHNLLTGPVATWPKRILETGLFLGLSGYGLLYPLLHQKGARSTLWLADHGLPVPPLYLSPYFVLAAWCEVRLFSFNEAEVAELLVAMALAFLALHHGFFLNQKGRGHASWLPALVMGGVVLASLAGAGLVSWYCWQAPRLHGQTVQRLRAGQEKFALRYERHGQWRHAATLYEELVETRSKNPELLRNLAGCYKELGEEQDFLALNGKAIRLDMLRHGRSPRLVSVNLSLSQSFAQRGKGEKAKFHLERAMAESRDKVLLEPFNAASFYWYGRCLQVAGDVQTAAEHLARAVAMEPSSQRYLQAYRRVLGRAAES